MGACFNELHEMFELPETFELRCFIFGKFVSRVAFQ